MDKFGRNYELTIDANDGGTQIILRPPLTLEFDITRTTLSSTNVCQLRIYNLSKENRNRIRFNTYANLQPPKFVTLKAGYGENLAIVFTGNISQAWSVREGVNFITQIEMFDGGFAFAHGHTNRQYPAGTPYRKIILDIMGDLPEVKIGAVGDFPGVLPRAKSFNGSPVDILNELTGFAFYVDSGRAYALKNNEYHTSSPSAVGENILLINNETGLLGTPILEQTLLHFDLLFEPSLQVGTKVRLKALTDENFDGDYVITAVKHRGIISEVISGSAITTGEFQILDNTAKAVLNATN